ncbi:Ion transport protein [Glomus cerebriforme]|uniref:Calcium-channel protein CCH1 n=1 Tax=Glomus cerebriforme TaxID=658196 RepID=A0A397SV15_9GLOM|nr:Ion transport protein [Glomus cerebriforme]
MERNDPPTDVPLVSLSTIDDSNSAQTTFLGANNHNAQTRMRGRSNTISPNPIITPDPGIHRRSRSISPSYDLNRFNNNNNNIYGQNDNLYRSRTLGHSFNSPTITTTSRTFINSSDQLLHDVDMLAHESSTTFQPIRMPSFLNMKRNNSLPDDDVVEMTDVTRRESFASELDFSHHEDSNEGFDHIDERDTAKLTKNRVDQSLDSSTSLPIPDEDQEFASSYGKNSNNRVNVLKHTKSLSRMSHMLARASTRVVNMANVSQEQLEKEELESNLSKSTSRKSWKKNRFSDKSRPTSNDNLDSSRNKPKVQFNGRDSRTIYNLQSQSPLEGRSLYIFGPTNPIRLLLYEILNHPWTESIILGLILTNLLLLIIDAWIPVTESNPRRTKWGSSGIDYALLVIFIIYTLEIVARIIVSGLIINPKQNSPPSPNVSKHNMREMSMDSKISQPSNQYASRIVAHKSAMNIAFLRHSFNRIDLLAVVSYWIDLLITLAGVQHFFLFKAISTLRSLRLLAITSGCATILQSLKKSVPLLVNVTSFVGFFFILLSIIGVQAFKGSLSRRCVWKDLNDPLNDFQHTDQYCGGWMDIDGSIRSVGSSASLGGKGFICPIGQVCEEVENPAGGLASFDNVFFSMILVFVISTTQNWTVLMYRVMDSDFDFASIYFILTVIILNFWLINLFVAVITKMFAKIREDTSHSAFTLSKSTPVLSDDTEGWTLQDGNQMVKTSWLARRMDETIYVWVVLIFADLFIMAFRTATMSAEKEFILDRVELIFTIVFAIEITLRFFSYLPKYHLFFQSTKNVVDFTLAIVTCIIQLPFIKESGIYPYLTLFQILRVYRVIIAIPRLRNLLVRVLGSVAGFANLVLFIFIVNFIAAIIGVQLLRGSIPDDQTMRFSDIYNSYLALYQLFSGEDWTTVLYNTMQYESEKGNKGTALIAVVFLIIYVSLSNFILLTMFIAVLQENFEIAEEQKHKIQLQKFKRNVDPTEKKDDVIYRWNFYKYFQAKPKALAVENIPYNLILHTQKSRVRDFLTDSDNFTEKKSVSKNKKTSTNFVIRLKRYFGYYDEIDKIPLLEGTTGTNDLGDPITDRPTEAFIDDFQEHQAIKADFLAAHPNYDASLWFLSPRNRFRRFCQLLVKSSHGNRVYGTPPSPTWNFIFDVFIYLCIIASVTLAAYVNLLYQKEYYEKNGNIKYPWFWITDVVFTGIFTLEFFIKIIADGFLLTPNAYLLDVWNQLDFFVLITLYINISIAPTSTGGVAKTVRAFKALRALRLINFSSSMKDTFYSILIAGAPRIIDASLLSISLVIPFAIYGVNIFAGLFYSCNDNDNAIVIKNQCVDEFENNIYNFNVLMPRVWSNPFGYNFDDFKSALLILFEIISGEGWIDVMKTSMDIVGRDFASQSDSTKWNALFFLVFNLAGSVFVLTLFVSVIISNYQLKAGTAYLTADQKRWIDLKKLLKQITPSKIPKKRPSNTFRAICFDYAIEKRGILSKVTSVIYVLHILLLMTEMRNISNVWGNIRDVLFIIFILIYILEFSIKAIGLGWQVFQNKWNLFDLIVITGAAATTISILVVRQDKAMVQSQKIFLVLICLKLFQKSDVMNQLFKNMIGSLPSILNLFAVWSIIFVIYTIIFMEIFGLTKYGNNESRHVNFRQFPTAVVTLIRMSTGEGWNSIMHDFTVESPYCVEDEDDLFGSDCGSKIWAYILFISWNVLSMYIFANMFIVVVSDNFSYCHQIAAEFSLITRDEIRKFKKAWRAVDFDRTGYIKSDEIAKFFSILEGPTFQVRIYDNEFLIPNLVKNSNVIIKSAESEQLWGSGKQKHFLEIEDIDIKKLEQTLSKINSNQIYERRKIYNRLYQEALLTVEKDSNGNEKGISFTSMLIMLAHYKLTNDDRCLEIHEYVKRKEKLERVIDNVNRDRVKSLLRTIYWRKKFKLIKEQRLKAERFDEAAVGSVGVPRIMVNDSDAPTLRIDTSLSSQTRNIRGPPSPVSSAGTPQIPNTPGSPGSPNSVNSDHHISDYLDYFGSRTSIRRSSGEYSSRLSSDIVSNEGENLFEGSWNSIDANTEMDDQTANQILNNLQSNYWHDVLQEMSNNDS